MKQLLITITAVLLVGCGESQKSAPASDVKAVEPVVEAAKPEPPTAKVPEISIHDATASEDIEAVKQHLAAGTDVNAKEIGGNTPLHVTATSRHKEMAELLIAKGADVNAKDNEGNTPLDWIDVDDIDSEEIADLLRKHGGKTAEELKAAGN